MAHITARRLAVVATLAAVLSAVTAAAQDVGTIAALEGSAQIGRGETWIPATLGASVAHGDELQTGRPGRLRIIFQDDSVLTLGDDSQVTVDEQVFRPAQGEARSLFQLLRGKVRAVVSDYYDRRGARYEVTTVNAVAGVRGTEFAMAYDPASRLTEVIGISGVVSVHSAVDPTGPGVLVTASEATTIAPGQLPSAPRQLDGDTFRQQLMGIDFIGGGGVDSMSGHPIVAGSGVPAPDQAGVFGGVAAGEEPGTLSMERPDASSLLGQSPAAVKNLAGQGQLDIDLGRP